MAGVERSEVIRGLEPRALYDVVTDYEAYPGFFRDFTRVRILEKQGPVWTVEFTARVVKEVSYTLAIVHDEEALRTEWTFVEGKLVTDSRGGWKLTAVEGGTRVDYHADLEVNAPLPGFIKKKIQNAILNQSIATMFKALEAEARRRAR